MKKFKMLSRAEMKNVLGGLVQPGHCNDAGECYITIHGANYSNPQQMPSFANTSQEAQQLCVDLIATAGNGVYHCKYNCNSTSNPPA